MPGPPPAVAALRVAVRRALSEGPLSGAARSLHPGASPDPAAPLLLVACSGGADSLALAAGTAFVAQRLGWRAGAVVVDHGLQAGSADVAASAAATCRQLGLAPVEVVTAQVEATGQGPEADARRARYAAITATAGRLGARAVLLGHTLDDQAEQVLLGLVRGSGARSLSGMPAHRVLGGGNECAHDVVGGGNECAHDVLGGGNECAHDVVGGGGEGAHDVVGREEGEGLLLVRPLLGVSRAQTRQACAELGLDPWQDPHNEDERFARVRARRALAVLERELGPGGGVVSGLARSAALLRDDADALDEAARTAYLDLGAPPWRVRRVEQLPRAVRTRLWRRLALAAGSPGTDLTSEHLLAVDTLVTAWRGQGPLHLPGGVRASRTGQRVHLTGPRS